MYIDIRVWNINILKSEDYNKLNVISFFSAYAIITLNKFTFI